MRVGTGKSVVDNAGAGGIICEINAETGEVIAAKDENGFSYDIHPDSGFCLIGFKIPRWNEAVILSKTLARVIPEMAYCGWDLALTSEGWIMIEANPRGQFLWQIPRCIGFRVEIEEILSSFNIDYNIIEKHTI